MAMDLLTKTEVEHFLKNVLQLKDPFARLNDDRVALLHDIMRAFLECEPFQSVTAIATPKSKRRGLTFEEIKTAMASKMGGLCCECNYFMKVLLEILGYDVYYITFCVNGIPDSHMGLVVRNLVRSCDHHLVDVGVGFFLPEPIPLDFSGDSPVRKDGFLRHRYVRDQGDGSLRWLHAIRGDAQENADADPVQGWRTFGISDLQPRPIEFFLPRMDIVHTIERGPEALSSFLISLRSVIFKDGKLIAIKDSTLLEEDASGTVHKRRFVNENDMLEAFKIHFPQIPLDTVRQALETLDLNFSE